MMKNIIFDLGKVLVDYRFEIFFTKYNVFEIDEKFSAFTPLYETFNCGEISKKQFLMQMKKFLKTNNEIAVIENDWADIFTLLLPMVEFAKELSEHYKIFIFSNTDEIHFKHIYKKFPELNIFGDNLMLSYELQAIKPSQKAYISALQKFKLNPNETLFIDDRIENVNSAKIFGIESIQHYSFEETKIKVKKILKNSHL